jgi:hypothetical protein
MKRATRKRKMSLSEKQEALRTVDAALQICEKMSDSARDLRNFIKLPGVAETLAEMGINTHDLHTLFDLMGLMNEPSRWAGASEEWPLDTRTN